MPGIPDSPGEFPDFCASTASILIVELGIFIVFVFPLVEHLVNQALDIPFGPVRFHLYVEFPTNLLTGFGLSGPVPVGGFFDGVARPVSLERDESPARLLVG